MGGKHRMSWETAVLDASQEGPFQGANYQRLQQGKQTSQATKTREMKNLRVFNYITFKTKYMKLL